MPPTLLRAVVGAGLSMLVLVAPSPAVSAGPDTWTVIAHRGYPGGVGEPARHTENSLAALNRARRSGAPAVEIDLRRTADGAMVVTHDDTLDRTTTCRGWSVREATLGDMLDRCRGRVGGEPMLAVDRALAWGRKHRVNVILDLKDHRVPEEQLRRLVQTVGEARMRRRVTFMSFHADVLRAVEAVDSALATQFILDARYPGHGALARTADVVNLRAGQLSRSRVRALHRRGLRVCARNTNSTRDWERARRTGVTCVLTDRVSDYRRWRRRG